MIRHIELTIDFDLTCWAESMEDFENDTEESIKETIDDYIINDTGELLDYLTIKKIWYEEDEQSSFYLPKTNKRSHMRARAIRKRFRKWSGQLFRKLAFKEQLIVNHYIWT